MKNLKINIIVFLLFLLLVGILRFAFLNQSILGGDETLYILMAKSMTEGHVPYTAIWDNKPMGIYVLFYAALLLLGKSITSIRILTIITVSITCYFLYLLGKDISKNGTNVGLLAGTLYAVFSLESGGIESNTELFFTPVVALAFYLLFSGLFKQKKYLSHNYLKLLAIGLCMGVALQIKQVVIFDFLAIIIIIFLHYYHLRRNSHFSLLRETLASIIILSVGLIIPFAITCLYFLLSGHFADYYYANFTANLLRVGGESISPTSAFTGFLIHFKSTLLLWICLLLTPFYLLPSRAASREEKIKLIYLLVWALMAFLGVCAPKSFYVHYFLQILPILCLISSYIIIKTIWTINDIEPKTKLLLLFLILAYPIFINVYPYVRAGAKTAYYRYLKGNNTWGDGSSVIAEYLQPRITKNDYIYVVDYPYVLYFLVSAKAPTKYVFSDFLRNPSLSRVAGINPLQELSSIMAKQPLYIIKTKQNLTPENQDALLSNQIIDAELYRYLNRDYVLDKEFLQLDDPLEEENSQVITIQLYRLKSKDY